MIFGQKKNIRANFCSPPKLLFLLRIWASQFIVKKYIKFVVNHGMLENI